VVAILVAAHFLLFTWRIDPPLLDGDDAVYLIMADFFSPFSGRDETITGLVMRHSYFPPLYPLLLGLAGGVSNNTVLAHLVTVAFLFGAMVALYLWSCEISERCYAALTLACLVTILPATVYEMFGLVSEGLYLLITLLALFFAARDPTGNKWRYFTAAAVGLAIVSRTVGFALWLAYTIWLTSGRRPGWKTLPLVALIPWLVWTVWKWGQGYAASYGGNVEALLEHQSIWGFVSYQLAVAPRDIWHAWTTSLNHFGNAVATTGGTIVGLIVVAGLARRLWVRSLDGIYVSIYLAVLLIWPYSYEARRLLFVILPILLVQGWIFAEWAGAQVTRWAGSMRHAGLMYIGLIGIVAFPSMYSMHERLALGWQDGNRSYAVAASWYTYSHVADAKTRIAEQLALAGAWRELGSRLGRDECVYHLKPVAFMLYADRPAYATPQASSRSEFWQRATLCQYFYLGAFFYPPYRVPFYPKQYLEPDARVVSIDYFEENGRKRPLGMLVRADRRANE